MLHPLHKFQYCPACGSAQFCEHDFKSKHCAACGFVLYHNASAAVVAVIQNARGDILAVRRALEPARGTLDLPGGFVDPGETLEQALRREVAEETGGRAEVGPFLFSVPNVYRYSDFEVHTTDAFFRCKIPDEMDENDWSDSLSAGDDAAETLWLNPARLNLNDFGLASVREGLRRLFFSDK